MINPPRNGHIIFALLVAVAATSLYGGFPMSSHFLELTCPEHAYLFGFIQADGHLYKNPKLPNKGKLQIELSERDIDILQKLQGIIPVKTSITSRVRSTNFTKGELRQTFTLTACDMAFRQELEALGVPCGKKSRSVNLPTVPCSEVDYFRGVIDGDGSLGLTAGGFPYLSLVTAGDAMAANYIEFVRSITGHKIEATRNKRDGAYNLMVTKEKAVDVLRVLYYEGCLAMGRKKEKAAEAISWIRPADMLRVNFERRKWTREEDAVVMKFSPEESSLKLNRTLKSVSTRKWRLEGSIPCV